MIMLRISQFGIGLWNSVSKHSLRTLRRPRHVHGECLSGTAHLHQQSDMVRRASTSQTVSTDRYKHDEGVVIRPATHADCAAIKAIDRDIHGGSDTFLYSVHHYISTENIFTYVAEISNQIVAYLSGHVIDDGETIIIQDARVTEKHRGKAAIIKLGHVMVTDAAVRFPTLRWTVFVLTDERLVQQRLSRGKQPVRHWTTPIEVFQIHSNKLKTLCKGEIFDTLEKTFKVDDIQAFPKRKTLELLTQDIRFLDFAPPRPMFGWQPSGWHASTLGKQLQNTDLFMNRCQHNANIQAFSFLTTTRNEQGIEVGLSFYYDGITGSEELAISHLLYAIREMTLLHSDTKIECWFHHPLAVSRECVKNILNVQLGIPSNVDKEWKADVLEYRLFDPFK